jgi:hypothetical protein
MKYRLLLSAIAVFILGVSITSKASEPEHVAIRQVIGIQTSQPKSIPGLNVQSQLRGQLRLTSDALEVPLHDDRPFVGLAIHWTAEVNNPHQVEISVRGSSDGNEWTEWLGIGVDHHVTLDHGVFAGELVFLPQDIHFVQYQVLLTPTLMHTNPRLDEIKLYFINPGVTSADELTEFRMTSAHLANLSTSSDYASNRLPLAKNTDLQFNVSYELPTYVDRTQWGGNLNLMNIASRTQTTVSHLIVHHSAGHNTSVDFAAVVRSYYILHTQTNGWSDIGYNWLIDRNGVLYQGRAFNFNGSMDVVGAHMGGGNSFTMGVCLIGDFSNVQPTEQAVNQLRDVLAWKAHERDIDVRVRRSHTLGNLHTISGHRDGNATQCPGNLFYPRLPEIRSRTHAYLNPPVILSQMPQTSSVSPSVANILTQIHTKGSAVAGFVEYGLAPDNLSTSVGDFELAASDMATDLTVEISGLTPGIRYYYRVVALNSETVSSSEVNSFVAGDPTSIEVGAESPSEFTLSQNYPNPFNPGTVITYQLPESGRVRISVYNVQGQLVRVVADQLMITGNHQIAFDATGLASGVYVYTLEFNGSVVQSRKMTILE